MEHVDGPCEVLEIRDPDFLCAPVCGTHFLEECIEVLEVTLERAQRAERLKTATFAAIAALAVRVHLDVLNRGTVAMAPRDDLAV